MKKLLIITYILLLIPSIYTENIYGPYNYTRLNSEAVKWSPDEGIYYNSLYLSITSEYGKIYYVINNDLNLKEPSEYKNEIFLKGKEGDIIDYNVLVILEKENNKVELYSRVYRIDMTKKYQKSYFKKIDYVLKNVNFENDKIKINYTFNSDEFGISFKEREFVFPQNIIKNEKKSQEVELLKDNKSNLIYLVNLTYKKEDKLFTEIHTYDFDYKKVMRPTFGSLYWGQVYKQSYKLEIRPYDQTDTIYYWLREWKTEDLILGPPSQTKLNLWQKYDEPVTLSSKYGKDGIIGIAAYSVGKDGDFSEIAGPYYFKVMDVDKTFEQTFENGVKDENKLKKVYLNDEDFTDKQYLIKNKVVLKFSSFDKDDMFYFEFKSRDREGKSDLISCYKDFTFINNDNIPVDFIIYMSNGQKLGQFTIYNEKFNLPVLKKYYGNYISFNKDAEFEFYMPLNKVRYEATTNQLKYLDITKDSNEFTGILKLTGNDNEEKTYKIKFGAFDENNNLIAESEEYFFKIDKVNPNKDITVEGIEINSIHNEVQTVKLIPPEKNGKVFYRLSKDNDWILYDTPLSVFPPINGEFRVNVYCKFTDEAGNERENQEPVIINFDTRGIYVDSNQKFSGNGTKEYPYNSMERAIEGTKSKGIKIIYILSEINEISFPLIIKNDVIIQPYELNTIPVLNLESKAVWRKFHVWFDISASGYLELRNIDFNIKSGGIFAYLNQSKVKIYNSNIIYTGIDSINIFKNIDGKLGISNVNISSLLYPENFTFLESANSDNIIKNIEINANANNLVFSNLQNVNYLNIDNLLLNVVCVNKLNLFKMDSSNVNINKFIYKQSGDFTETLLFELNKSNLAINQSDFIIDGKKPFSIGLIDAKKSELNINSSLFWSKKSSNMIGLNIKDSELLFETSLIRSDNVIDYVYDIRSIKSKVKLYSSVVLNKNCSHSVNFILDNSEFESINNSIFNYNIKNKSFGFWISDVSKLISVNSLYYFDKKQNTNAFIYINNDIYDSFKPVWFSNVISTDVILKENLDTKDLEYIIRDYGEKNLLYNFDNNFNFEANDFFIPLIDSPLLQGGMPEYNAPVKIPKIDFLGKNRIISGIGIDIGAVQKSGNF